MKKRLFAILALIPLFILSCDDEPSSYTSIKGLESLIYQSIKGYRLDHKLDGPFVHQLVMIREAQIYSYKMANVLEELGTQGLPEHWNEIHEKIGGYKDQALVMSTTSANEDEILTQLLQIPHADSILLEDVTQCAVGIESNADGLNYLTVMLMKVDS
jgi:hypothetical protein